MTKEKAVKPVIDVDYEMHLKLQEEHAALQNKHAELETLFAQILKDTQAFIRQCDREGVGMQTVCDHRVRVEKFFNILQKLGRME